MRTTTTRAASPPPARRTPLTVVVVACLTLPLTAPPAAARPADLPPGTPSRAEVDAAQRRTGDAAAQVASTEAELAAANRQLEAAAVTAEQAAEAANGARWRLQEATKSLRQARRDARRAASQVRDQRGELAGLVSAGYESAGDVSALDAAFGGRGPEGVMSRLLTYEGATTSVEAQLQGFAATSALAGAFRDRALEVRARRTTLAAEAASAQRAAAAAAAAAQQAATSTAERKQALVAELARLQGISVELAEARQSGVEEAQRRAAAEAAQRAARQEARAAAAAVDADADRSGSRAPDDTRSSGGRSPERENDAASSPIAPAPPPPATPPAPPPVVTPPPSASGAQRALAFARAQVGEPYRWGAAGPDAWDCSGLTMAAWAAGGRSLPHYSVAQYDQTTPITAGQLRPGDLVFWGSTSSPSSIHHVALYLGGGMIVHAPRTGRDVSVESMYYWVPPNFFGRV